MKKREVTLPTLVGLLVAMAGLVSGLWLLRGQLRQAASASVEEAPKGVRITTINDSSFTVSWVTEKAASGFVQYGEAAGELDLVVSDERDQQRGAIGSYYTHLVTVRGLKPITAYEFRVGSGKNLYEDETKPFKVSTGPALANPPPADVAYGQVVTANGDPAEGTIVYLELAGAVPQAAMVKTSGSWVIPLSTARSSNVGGYVQYDKEAADLGLFMQGGPMGSSTVTVKAADDSPVPQVVLGQIYDYTNKDGEGGTEKQGGEEVSKFSASSLAPATESQGAGELLILTPKFGEKVNSFRPEIVGEAPPGSEVEIEIHSPAIVKGAVVAGSNGRFSYSTPADLPPGEHTLTITAIVDGVKRRISRTFTVYAAGESNVPAFSATPSATIRPSPTGSARPSPTVRPSPTSRPTVTPTISGSPGPSLTVTPKPSPTLRPTPTTRPSPTPRQSATDSGLIEAGNESGTWLLVVVGGILLSSGWWWYRRAE